MDSSDDDCDQGKIEQMQLARALQFQIGTLCRQEEDQEHRNEGSTQNKHTFRMSQSAIAALTELTYHYATKCLGPDLIKFSQHGNRKTINVDDVKLAARRNPNGVLDSLKTYCEDNQDQIDIGYTGNKHRSKKRFRTSNANQSADIGVHKPYDIGDSDDDSESDASLGVGPSSDNIGRSASHDNIKFDLQIQSSSSSSSESDIHDEREHEEHESDEDPIQSNTFRSTQNTSNIISHPVGTSLIHNGTSVLDDSDSDIEMRLKRNSTTTSSRQKDEEYIELLDSD